MVHEAFLRLMGGQPVQFSDRVHFFSVAAKTVRRVLVDYARRASAQKRWGGYKIEMEEHMLLSGEKTEQIVVLEQALEQLESASPRQCRVVELRYFAGLELDEVAIVLGVSRKTVQRDWTVARAWLHARVGQQTPLKG